MRKIYFSAFISKACLLLPIIISVTASAAIKSSSRDEIKFLVSEMTTTPMRQQTALDKLAQYDEEALICLSPYFEDERPIASKDVKFLNTAPTVGEKYFLTRAERIGDVLIQYFCWRTARCSLTSSRNMTKIKQEVEIDFKMQRRAKGASNFPCASRPVQRSNR